MVGGVAVALDEDRNRGSQARGTVEARLGLYLHCAPVSRATRQRFSRDAGDSIARFTSTNDE